MAKINLRPWREERSAARQKQFITNVLAACLVGAAVVFVAGTYYDIQMDRQGQRNTYLQGKITDLDAKLKEIEELKAQRERLLARLNAIQELQGNRPIIVRNFDELVRVLPDSINYTAVERKESGFKETGLKGDTLRIEGIVAQNKDVSELMRNMDNSIWFGEPDLAKVGDINSQAGVRSFDLRVLLAKPKAEETQ
ncbi:PilN domain-containing protein [Neptunomonas phycophila]|mgnify:CR=1 FL=1|jgi:type IV pilus assembly protein PilN|uniref:PilN domain-containing protein n=1 Tax=Neptunomonas phycophila TaxID=1572645 RepID=A0AAW7XHM4_9GAMM|nr:MULTISPECIES: PilN domain-containing protein [Neptunomonas]MBT3144576.1 PilN domain-containing protein [Neptunomonas phycophila]MDN2660721.1 PilN domain-containing protein [Neptunomonas sp. CHC150]MDO6453662.1 PilN domain-containing protein [Neptunomonas phycophila]MDO6468028.1 PilN domain-containing protein [Neptunomonas phycophila]MDO6784073.1 PilN domain-containing protein [Neptunomonas phycophila]